MFRFQIICIVLLTAFVVTVQAQELGSVQGAVTDQTGAVIPGANVQITHEGTGRTRDAVTSDLGSFEFAALQLGEYSIQVQNEGFQTYIQQGIVLQALENLRLDIELQVGAQAESVTVVADALQLETVRGTQKEVIDRQRVEKLPLDGRNPLQLISLVAGGIQRGQVDQFIQTPSFAVNGAKQDAVNYKLDGADHNDSWFGSSMVYPNPDALQEFTVQTNNFTAQYGRDGGAVITGVVKSGTNEYHGTAYWYLRNDVLDARPFHAAERPTFRRGQYGATVGGPIVKDKTFWFFAYEGTRQFGSPGVKTYTTLDAAERAGDFSGLGKAINDPLTGDPFPNSIIPASRVSPITGKFMDRFLPFATLPNKQDTVPLDGFRDVDQYVTRIDHTFTERDTLSFRMFINDRRGLVNYNAGIGPGFDWFSDSDIIDQSFTLNYTRVFAPTVVNHLNVSFVRRAHEVVPKTVFTWAEFGAEFPTNAGQYPDNWVGVGGRFATWPGFHWINARNNPYVSENLSWTVGRHSLNFGAEWGQTIIANRTPFFIDGFVAFNGGQTGDGGADFVTGALDFFLQYSPFQMDLRQARFASWVQDDWQVHPRLTLNLGVRWEPFFPHFETVGRQATWIAGQQSTRFPKAPEGQLFPFDDNPAIPDRDTLVPTDWNNMAPRLGFAWDPTGSRKFSVRGAYGIFFSGQNIGIRIVRGSTNQPFTKVISTFGQTIRNPFTGPPFHGNSPFPFEEPVTEAQAQAADFSPNSEIIAMDPDFATPYIQQYNLSVQYQLGRDWMAEVGYVGRKSSKIFNSHDINSPVYIPGVDENGNPLSTTANNQQRRPFPFISKLEVESTSANANYNSLQLKLNKRFSKGLTANTSYVWSKSLGWNVPLGEGGGGTRDQSNHRLDYGRLAWDAPHRFVNSFLWDLPWMANATGAKGAILGGWGVQGIISFQSGFPFSVLCGCDSLRQGRFVSTANQIGNAELSGGRSQGEKLKEWFNTAAWETATIGTVGESGINILTGPGFVNTDLAVSKTFALPYKEGHQLMFRAEFFNLTNNTNFANPGNNLIAPNFGQILGASGTPRVIEFALKYIF